MDINFEGVAHYGLIPIPTGPQQRRPPTQDMSVLFTRRGLRANVGQMPPRQLRPPAPLRGRGRRRRRWRSGGAIIPMPNARFQISYVAGVDGSGRGERRTQNWQPANVLSSVTNGVVCTIQVLPPPGPGSIACAIRDCATPARKSSMGSEGPLVPVPFGSGGVEESTLQVLQSRWKRSSGGLEDEAVRSGRRGLRNPAQSPERNRSAV